MPVLSKPLIFPEENGNISLTSLKFLYLLDKSGSMAGGPEANVKDNLLKANELAHTKCIVPFGPEEVNRSYYGNSGFVYQKFNDILEFIINYRCNSGTYTDYIARYLNESRGDEHAIIFHGDGGFNQTNYESKFSSIIERAAILGKLSNLKYLFITFAYNTHQSIIDTLTNEVSSILMNCRNAIIVKAIKFDRNRDDTLLNILQEVQSGRFLNVPNDYYDVSGIFGFPKDMTPMELARELEKYPEVAEQLFGYMTETAEVNCEIFNSQNSIYPILHKCLCHYYNEDKRYGNWMVSFRNKFPKTSIQYQSLNNLIKKSFQDNKQIEKDMKMINDNIIGYMTSPINDTEDAILEAIRSKILVIHKINHLFKNADYVPNTDKRTPIGRGMPVLNDTATSSQCRVALKMLFCQYGTLPMSNMLQWVSSLTLLTSGFELDTHIINMVKKAFFGDLEYTLKMMGYDSETKVFETDPLFYSRNLIKMLSYVFTHYENELFPLNFNETDTEEETDVKKFIQMKIKKIIFEFKKMNKLFTILYSLRDMKTFQGSYEHTHWVEIGSNGVDKTIRTNNIYFVPPYEKDPQLNLPSVVFIISAKSRNIKCEYLDRKLKSNDIIRFKRIPDDYEFLCNATDVQIQNLNETLMKMHKNEPSVENMEMGADLVPKLLEANKQKVLDILDLKSFETRVDIFKQPIPNELIFDHLKISETIRNFIKSGSNPNKIQLQEFVNEPMEEFAEIEIPNEFKFEGNMYKIEDGVFDDTRKIFNDYITKEHGEINIFAELSIVQCCICYDECHHTEMPMKCSQRHWICSDCSESMNPSYPQGTDEIISNSQNCCPYCKEFLKNPDPRIQELYERYPDGLPNTPIYRPCSKCDNVFGQENVCGGDERHLDTLCETCNIPSGNKKCPGCDEYLEKNGGCYHMHCQLPTENGECDTHWCWHCQEEFDTADECYDHLVAEHGSIF